MPFAIESFHLGKQYRLGSRRRYLTIRESLIETATAPVRYLARSWKPGAAGRPASANTIWALRDLNFAVERGGVVGIIGRNGSGKSTLLKCLSRVTEPTTGTAVLRGRVGSLLEVGTGFHPELTGRENIFLSGAILGMRRAEVARRFDEIVDFAGVEEFLETPIKHYSSGMAVRLGFAVAAHLEAEILLVDEVLAVGDAAFQSKCLSKIGDVARSGRTVLFVSHNMASVEALCSSAILLDRGHLVIEGTPRDVVDRYAEQWSAAGETVATLAGHPGRQPGSIPLMTRAYLASAGGEPVTTVRMGDELRFVIEFESERPIRPVPSIEIKTARGVPIFETNSRISPMADAAPAVRAGAVTCTIPAPQLNAGRYVMNLWLADGLQDEDHDLDVIVDAFSIDVVAADVFGTGKLPNDISGPIWVRAEWQLAGTANSASGSAD
jgi:lipopolysaccharide transport system ATP-binding protein